MRSFLLVEKLGYYTFVMRSFSSCWWSWWWCWFPSHIAFQTPVRCSSISRLTFQTNPIERDSMRSPGWNRGLSRYTRMTIGVPMTQAYSFSTAWTNNWSSFSKLPATSDNRTQRSITRLFARSSKMSNKQRLGVCLHARFHRMPAFGTYNNVPIVHRNRAIVRIRGSMIQAKCLETSFTSKRKKIVLFTFL